jgi:hypothetical protein
MGIKNFQISDIVDRIYMTLPTKFTRDASSNLYAFLSGLSSALQLNDSQIDELYRQTNLITASGEYLDDYVVGLSNIGRKYGESDDDYRNRYLSYTYKYGNSKQGIQNVVVDIVGNSPMAMYVGRKRGAYFNGRKYLNSNNATCIAGASSSQAYTGYIQFSRKPNKYVLQELIETIEAAKAFGVQIYLVYPATNNLIIDTSSEMSSNTGSERVVIL